MYYTVKNKDKTLREKEVDNTYHLQKDHVWGVKSPSFFFLLCIHLPARQLLAACAVQMRPPKENSTQKKS